MADTLKLLAEHFEHRASTLALNHLYSLVGKSVGLSYSRSCCAEVGCSNPGRGTIVGGVFRPTRQLAMFSPPNMHIL